MKTSDGAFAQIKMATVAALVVCGSDGLLAAATIRVTSLANTGPGSLRQALADAKSGDTIQFAVTTGRITLADEWLEISKDLTITGPGATQLTVRSIANDDYSNHPLIFNIEPGVTVTISGLTIADGEEWCGDGGGISNLGSLTVLKCVLSNNSAGRGGAIFNDKSANLTVIDSLFVGNSTCNTEGGGAIYNVGEMTVLDSTFSSNGGYYSGGAIINDGNGSITNSTFVQNLAEQGGAVYNTGTLNLVNCTIANNTAASGGDFGQGWASGQPPQGGGILNAGGSVTIRNCVIAGNSFDPTGRFGEDSGGSGPDCAGIIISRDHNLIQNPAGCTINGTVANNVTGQDPRLGPLQNNGGPIATMALLSGSPAIDNGDDSSAPPLDQRGYTRIGRSDMGAFEFGGRPAALLAITTQPQSQTNNAGADVTFSVAATGSPPLTYQWRFNGTAILSATNTTLTLTNIQKADQGSYDVVVSNATGTVTSQAAAFRVRGLVAWWRMNEAGSGPVLVGQVQDYAPGPNSVNTTGTVGEDNPVWTTAGVPNAPASPDADGRAILLDGLGDDLEFGQGASNELQITGALSLWGRIQLGFLGGATIAQKSGNDAGALGHKLFYNERFAGPDGSVTWELSETGAAVDLALNAPAGSFPQAEWLDIAAVFQPSSQKGRNDGSASLYQDGALIATVQHDLVRLFDSSEPFKLGESLPIAIEQFRVFDMALSPAEVAVLSRGAANTPPTISNITNQASNEDTPSAAVSLTVSDVETAAVNLKLMGSSSAPSLVPAENIVFTGSGANRTVTVTPIPDQFGTTTIAIIVLDAGGLSATNHFDLSVLPVNDPPSFTKGADQTVDQDSGTHTVPNWAANLRPGPANEAGQILTFQVSNNNNALFSVQPAISPAGTLSFTPAPNASGSATVTVLFKDDGGTANGGVDTSAPQTFNINITVKALSPTITSQPQSLQLTLGQTASFSVAAEGTAPLSYQWRKDGANLIEGVNLSGATSSTLTIVNAQASDAGSYDVVVSNTGGSATSSSALLTLTALATLMGVVTDALNGQPLANVAVSAGGHSNLTDAQGSYMLTNLTAGVFKADFDADVTSGNAPLMVHFANLSTTAALTLTGEKASYATYRNTAVAVTPGQTNTLSFSLSPVLTQGLRAVLNWGPLPKDLDLHLQIEGTPQHVWFNDRNTPYGRLDHDVTEGWGPETLTVDQFYPGLYHYYVEQYDVFIPGSRLTNSAAQVLLYRGAEELKVISVPTSGAGAFWHVCTVDGETGAILVINQITDDAALPAGTRGDTGGSAGGGGLAGAQFLWDFGDGTTSTNASPVKVYGQAGSYRVSLRVEGEQGQSDVQVKPGFVVVSGGDGPRLGVQWVDGQAVLRMGWAVGKTCRIEVTSRLGPAAVWQTVATLTLSQPDQTWGDDQSGNLTTRFYRAVSP